MTILGIETASETLSVALLCDGAPFAEYFLRKKNIHDTMLMPLTQELLKDSGLTMKDLQGIAISAGPGSFTGLRIGMSFAKGIAYGGHLPLACVPTFDGIAYAVASSNIFTNDTSLAVVFDARREDVYVACYRVHGTAFTCIKSAQALHVADAVTMCPDKTWLVGNGAKKMIELLNTHFNIIEGELAECHATAIAVLGSRMIFRGEIADVATCEPYYAKEFFTTTKK